MSRGTGPESEPRSVRRVVFFVLAGLLTLLLVLQWWVVLTPFLVWFPAEFVDEFFGARVEDFSAHRIHRLALAASHLAVIAGLVVQFRRPRSKQAPMWQVSGFFILAIVVNLIVRPSSEQLPPFLWIVFALGIALGFLHPSSPLTRVPRSVDRRMLGLVAVMAVPMLVYAIDQLGLQMSGVDSDPHWAGAHYQFVAEYGFHLVLVAFLGTTALTGRRITTWTAGLMAVVMGIAAIVFPDQASSVGALWGALLMVWGVAFILVGERREGVSTGDTTQPASDQREVRA